MTVDRLKQKGLGLDYQVLEQLVDTSVDAIQISDEEGRFLYLNEVAARRLGIDIKQVSNYYVPDIEATFDGRDCPKWKSHVYQLKAKKNMLLEGTNKNLLTGEEFPVEVAVSYRVVNGQGLIVASSRDISIRKKLQAKLFRNAKSLVDHYQVVSFIHAAVNSMFLSGAQLNTKESIQKIVEKHPVDRISYYVNQPNKKQFIRIIYGCSSRIDDLSLPLPVAIISHLNIEEITVKMKSEPIIFYKNGFEDSFSFEGKEIDQHVKTVVIFPLLVTGKIYGFIKLDYFVKKRNIDKRLQHFMGIYASILNSALQLEVVGRELQRTNLVFKQITQSSGEVFFLYSVQEDYFDFVSPKIEQMLGIDWKEGMSIKELAALESNHLFAHAIERLHKENYVEYEFRINLNSEDRYILKKLNAIRDDKGRLVKISGLYSDITYRKKATFELTKSLELISDKNLELESKNEQIRALLKKQEADLYVKTVKMSQKSGLLAKVDGLINELEVDSNSKSSHKLNRIKKYLNDVLEDRSKTWEELRVEFEKIRPNFFKNLSMQYSDLSANDLKHCYYIVTGLNNKETADLLNVTVRTIETARYRIKKKFKLDASEKLIHFLEQIA